MELKLQTMDWSEQRRKNKIKRAEDLETIKKATDFMRDYYRSIHNNPCLHPELNPK